MAKEQTAAERQDAWDRQRAANQMEGLRRANEAERARNQAAQKR